MSASPYGRGLVGLLKQGWNEIPAVMGSSVFAVLGIGIAGYMFYVNETRGIHPSKYKNDYIVVRPDDPLVNKPVNSYPD